MKPATEDIHIEVDLNKYDPEYIDECWDPLRAAKEIIAWWFIAFLFWGGLCFIVWAANTYIGGG